MTLKDWPRSVRSFWLLVLLALGCLALGRFFYFEADSAKQYFTRFPIGISSAVFVAAYVVLSAVIWVGPKDALRLAAAFVYGPYISTVLVTAGEMINLLVMFGMSRKLGRPFVAQCLRGRMRQVDQAIAESRYGTIFLLRLLVLFPLRFLDLGFGLTKISLTKYFLISLLATPPRIFVVQFFWSLGMDTVVNPEKFADYLSAHPGAMALMFGYLIFSVAGVVVLRRRSRKTARPPEPAPEQPRP